MTVLGNPTTGNTLFILAQWGLTKQTYARFRSFFLQFIVMRGFLF